MQQSYSNWSQINSLSKSVDRVLDLTKIQPKTEIKTSKREPLDFKSLSFEQVSFYYKSNKKYILNQVDFCIKKGDVVGIIGATGSGKSTLIDLLLGLIEPTEGQVKVNGISLQNCTLLQDYQSVTSLVPQSIYLADASIAQNIAFNQSDEKINLAKLKKSAEIACANNFISKLSNNYYHLVGENGSQISGGERQRIGIAREFIKIIKY